MNNSSALTATVVILNKDDTEGVQTIIPASKSKESSSALINKLMTNYGDRPNYSKPSEDDMSLVRTAFPRVAEELLNPVYDGANLVTDTKQDLLGEKYLAEQIKKVNEENKKKSILDSYNYMLYEGDKSKVEPTPTPFSMDDLKYITPVQTTTFKLSDLF